MLAWKKKILQSGGVTCDPLTDFGFSRSGFGLWPEFFGRTTKILYCKWSCWGLYWKWIRQSGIHKSQGYAGIFQLLIFIFPDQYWTWLVFIYLFIYFWIILLLSRALPYYRLYMLYVYYVWSDGNICESADWCKNMRVVQYRMWCEVICEQWDLMEFWVIIGINGWQVVVVKWFIVHCYFVVIFFFIFFLIVSIEAFCAIDIFDEALYVVGFGHYTWKVEVISADF